MSRTENRSATALDIETEANASSLNHIYFFLQPSATCRETHTEINSAVSACSGESKEKHSRASSLNGSIGTDSASTGTTTSSTHSDLNPLAKEFKPSAAPTILSFGPEAIPPEPSASHLFELRRAEHSGLGLFATTFIKRGTLIICEEPLLHISKNALHHVWDPYCRLGNAQKTTFDALHQYQPADLDLEQASRAHLIDPASKSLDEEDVDEQVKKHVRVMSIFSVNNFQLPPNGLAVYATASRLNHSCIPNVHHSYNPTLKSLTVYAVRNIAPNEEFLITYLGGPAAYQIRPQRNEHLYSTYGFICQCPACSDGSGSSDGRRGLMSAITWGLMEFNKGSRVQDPFIPATPLAALRQSEHLISLLLAEGIVTIELTKAYRMASVQAVALHDFDTAFEYARNEMEVERNCLGGEINDLRKSKVAAECWTEQIYNVLRAEKGEAAVKAYREIARQAKKKVVKKQSTPKRKVKASSGGWKEEGTGNAGKDTGVV